jgi:hypothetical protein
MPNALVSLYGGFGPMAVNGKCLRDPLVCHKVCNRTNNPTPIAGPSNVARTTITNDFATITHPALTPLNCALWHPLRSQEAQPPPKPL